MMQNEKTISNVNEFINEIFMISDISKSYYSREKLNTIIDEIRNFQNDVKNNKLKGKNTNSKNCNKALRERLEKIIKYYHEFPFLDSLQRTFVSKFNIYINDLEKLEYEKEKIDYYYRGVYNGKKFNLLPSCFRDANYGKEDEFYHYIKAKCTSELNNRNHLDTLVTLQHYECPTRLLDITSNPLVALYFACKNYGCPKCDEANYGYVYVFANPKSKLLFKDSDRVIMLSCLARFSKKDQERMYEKCIDLILKEGLDATFKHPAPKEIEKLYHEIKTEVSFERRMYAIDLLLSFFVQPDNSNRRIDKQSGAFIISGLSKDKKEIEEKINSLVIYKFKIINQEKILEELDALNINDASLFPELDKVANYYKMKITKQ